MSRGLGKLQLAFLSALQRAEAETGPGHYRLDYIATQAYGRLESIKKTVAEREAERASADADLARRAKEGDKDAHHLMMLSQAIRGASRTRGGWYRSALPKTIDLNPSRVVRLLSKRGLVKRSMGGFVGLTDAGRHTAASLSKE